MDLKNSRVIVVDDFSHMRTSVKQMLLESGVTDIDLASNGEDALVKLSTKMYDIILCDYNLGEGKDGQQVLEEAHYKNYINAHSLFIMVTAENTLTQVLGALESQPDDYITKPFTRDALAFRLNKLIERKNRLHTVYDAIEKKNYIQALALCEQELANKPKNMLDLIKMSGDLAIRAKDYAKAVQIYQRVLTIKDLTWARFGLGQSYFLQKEYKKALKIFTDLLEDNPQYIHAYDWLSQCYEMLGDNKQAQEVLAESINLSKKSLLRQRRLGEVALKNGENEVAARAFRSAIRQGNNSCFREASEYVNLANILVEEKKPMKAITFLKEARKDLRDKPNEVIQAMIVEASAYNEVHKTKEALKALSDASKIEGQFSGRIDDKHILKLAESHLKFGDTETGNALLRKVAKNHSEEDKYLVEIQKKFGVIDDLQSILEENNKLNHRGITLVEQGKYVEAMELFEQACQGAPKNCSFNLNLAQSCMMQIDKDRHNEVLLAKIQGILEQIADFCSHDKRYQELLFKYKKLLHKK